MQFIIAQILGFVATFFSVLTFQLKTHKHLMLSQMGAAVFFGLHYLLLGAYAGAAINAVALLRDIVYYNKDKKLFASPIWTALFAIAIGAAGLAFWQNDGWYALIITVAMVLNTISFSFTDPQKVRVTILFSSPLLLVYNILTFSFGGIINELLAEISTVVGLIRYRRKKAE